MSDQTVASPQASNRNERIIQRAGKYAVAGIVFNVVFALVMFLFIELSFFLFVLAMVVFSSIFTGWIVVGLLNDLGVNVL